MLVISFDPPAFLLLIQKASFVSASISAPRFRACRTFHRVLHRAKFNRSCHGLVRRSISGRYRHACSMIAEEGSFLGGLQQNMTVQESFKLDASGVAHSIVYVESTLLIIAAASSCT
jgi:hypothetical protein